MKKKNELNETQHDCEELYKVLKIIQNEIAMKEQMLKDSKINETCRALTEEQLKTKRNELSSLLSIATGEAPGMNCYFDKAINESEHDYSNKKPLKKGEIGIISNYPVLEPAKENLFLVHGLNEFGLTESDILSYSDDSITKKITLTIRNNVVDCPIVKFNRLVNNSRSRIYKDIVIEILDSQLKPVYEIIYRKPSIRDLGILYGSYDSNQVQLFTVTLSYQVREMEKV